MGRADPGAAGGVKTAPPVTLSAPKDQPTHASEGRAPLPQETRSFVALRIARVVSLLAAATLACSTRSEVPDPLHLTTSRAGADTRVTIHAALGLKINARLAPALELPDGSVLRFTADRLTPDSAYFAESPTAILPGRHDQVHGTLRASVCREDEQVCRGLRLEI
jgi:hypothetical protein